MFGTTLSLALEPALAVTAGAPGGWPQGLAALVEMFGAIEEWVTSSTGVLGLVTVFVYSFLIAFVLPGPSEIVLLVPLNFGLPQWARLGLIMLVSGTGKALGSVVAFHVGQEAKKAGPIERRVRESRFDIYEWSEKTAVRLAKKYGYAGLAMALSVPFFPDTISIYAFAVLEEDYYKFAAATFAGSVGRLVVTIGLVGGGFAVGLVPFALGVLVVVGAAAVAWWYTRDDEAVDEAQPPTSGGSPTAGDAPTPSTSNDRDDAD